MRFHFKDARRHRQAAKALLGAMRGLGIDTGLTACLDLAARLYGYADRHELDACLGKAPESRWDEAEAPGIVAARRERHLAVLASAGIRPEDLAGVLAGVRPTERRPRPGTMARPDPVRADPRHTPPVPARPAKTRALALGGIDDLLAEWDDARAKDPAEILRGLVLDAYVSRATHLDIHCERHGAEEVWASGATGEERLCSLRSERRLMDHLAGMVGGEPFVVAHPDGDIPVRITSETSDNDLPTHRCRLLRDKAEDYGAVMGPGMLDGGGWEQALCSRVGLHILGVEKAREKAIAWAIGARSARDGIEARTRSDSSTTFRRYEETIDLRRHKPTEVRDGIAVVLGAPMEIAILPMLHASEAADRIVSAALRCGVSVVILARQGIPADWVRGMLLRGVTSEYIRAHLVSTAMEVETEGRHEWHWEVRGAPGEATRAWR